MVELAAVLPLTDLTAALGAYLLGSIPFGFLAGKLAGCDIRRQGSGNIGATNVLRVLGKPYGYAVFLADALKGLAAVAFALWLHHGDYSRQTVGIIAAAAAVIGHAFPVWLGFKGGKGVATAAGACLGLLPFETLVVGGVWTVTFFAFRFVSLASMIAAIALPVSIALVGRFTGKFSVLLLCFSIVLAGLVIVRHRSNIQRLLRGTEPRFARK